MTDPLANAAGADRHPYLSPEEERRLAQQLAAGDRSAETQLVLSHLRLVWKSARLYGRLGIPVADLVQEGTIGLIQAIRKFNPDCHNRLSTYASWWVRAAMQEHVVRTWSLVRVGKTASHRSLFLSLRRFMAGPAAVGRPDPAAAIPDELLPRLVERFRLPAAEIATMARRLLLPDQALDAPMGSASEGEEGPTLADQLADAQPTPEDLAEEDSLSRLRHRLLDSALRLLPEREAYIIRIRHLIDPAPTFDSIGRDLGISKDRVRQLEQRAITRLRTLLQPQQALLRTALG